MKLSSGSSQDASLLDTSRRRFFQSATISLCVGTGAIGGLSKVGTAQQEAGDIIWSIGGTDEGYGDNVVSSPSVADGTVYFATVENGTSLYAVSASDGSEEWKQNEPEDPIPSSPTVVNGMVYAGTEGGTLYAINADTGDIQWTFDIETSGEIYSSPTVWDETVYVGSRSGDDTLYAVNAWTGELEWQYDTIGSITSSPLVANETIYVGSEDGNVYAIDIPSRSQSWTFQTGGAIKSTPTISDSTIYVGSRDNNLYAINADTGASDWSLETGGPVDSSPTVSDGVVYFGSRDSTVYAVNLESGQNEWEFETILPVGFSSPTVVNGRVIVGTDQQDDDTDLARVYAIGADSGEQEWVTILEGDRLNSRTSPINSSPTVVDGTVFIGAEASNISDDKVMFALDAGVSGSSEDSRVARGTLGHHGEWSFQPAVPAYANNQGIIDNSGVRSAVSDWQSNNIDSELLARVLDAWGNNDPVF